jgi:hypothetical protein
MINRRNHATIKLKRGISSDEEEHLEDKRIVLDHTLITGSLIKQIIQNVVSENTRTLNFQHCNLTDNLANLISLRGTKIEVLALGWNWIGNNGAQALAKSLVGTSTKMVYLNNNQIGDEGARVLLDCLTRSSILYLSLWNNPINQGLLDSLQRTVNFLSSPRYSMVCCLCSVSAIRRLSTNVGCRFSCLTADIVRVLVLMVYGEYLIL